jgi:hypothetical protein
MVLSDEVTFVMVVVYREYENVSPTYIVSDSVVAAYTAVGVSTANAVTTNTNVKTTASNFLKCFIKILLSVLFDTRVKSQTAFLLAGKAFWLNDPHQHEEVAIFFRKSADSEWW